jgi:uncharacterized protein (TIGR02147 family)
MAKALPNIFEYINYRIWLGDTYHAARAANPAFSFRWFARRAGYSSPNFLKLVIDGQRNLSDDSIQRFATVLQLDDAERRFFADLVAFDQAANSDERNQAWDRIASSRRFRTARRIDHDWVAYLSRWYYPVIREMAARPDFRDDPIWISTNVLPAITAAQAREALELLDSLGLIVKSDDGTWSRGEPSITTGHEVRGFAAGNYHRQMLERAAASIDLVERDKRDISALTVCVTPEVAAEVKRRIHAFREQILEFCDREARGSAVYQLNVQLFPLTRTDGDL